MPVPVSTAAKIFLNFWVTFFRYRYKWETTTKIQDYEIR